jgi:putative Mg2+ transporter-C (MgtC) family protein
MTNLNSLFNDLFNFKGVLEFFVRGLVAVILGSLIGFERQWTRHPAGITNILVCIGSFFFTSFSFIFINDSQLKDIRDVTRVAAQVVAGIGFLGAGVIMRQGLNIRGLNTAATIWCSGSIGVLCAYGNVWLPIIGTVFILIVNVGLHPIARRIRESRTGKAEKEEQEGLIRIVCDPDKEFYIRSLLMQMVAAESIVLRNLQTSDTEGKVKLKATVIAEEAQEAALEKIIARLSVEKGVLSAGWYEL